MNEILQHTTPLPVMEHFYTIQGEGYHQGKAAYFIRLGGCDVGCVWCDVKDSWEKQTNYYWGNDEFSHGAYALYGKGQWFRVMPILKRSHIHTHFAGEHLADWQGFMEGAINTGEEAAAKI